MGSTQIFFHILLCSFGKFSSNIYMRYKEISKQFNRVFQIDREIQIRDNYERKRVSVG